MDAILALAVASQRLEAIAGQISGESALNGRTECRDRQTLKLSIIIRSDMSVVAIHPGEHLAEELKELRISAAGLARKLDVPTNRITAILHGQRAITGDTALRLAHFFGTSPEFWLNLQSLYELRVAQKRVGKSIKSLPRLKSAKRIPA